MLPTETDFEAKVSMETEAMPVPEDPPFHILLLGDYSGRRNLSLATDASLPAPKPIVIDRDNFDEVMKKLNVGLRLNLGANGAGTLPLTFKKLDDFHPDSIFRQIGLFSDLRDTRERLLNSDTFENAAVEVRSWFGNEQGEAGGQVRGEEETPEEISGQTGNLLEDILGQTKRESTAYAPQTTETIELKRFIREVVRPHLVTTDEAEQAKLLGVVDEATGDLMRSILHDPELQSLEAAWRGLYLLVRRTDTSNDLKLFVYDVSKEELVSDLKSVDDLNDTDISGVLLSESVESAGREPWALVCGNYDFALNVEDTAALIRLAKLANVGNAPFISHIRPQMLGIESLSEHATPDKWNLKDDSSAGKLWTMLRTTAEAASLGLCVPRFLARLPYGKETEPTEAFSFEEFTDTDVHDQYLWANPSFICALLLAQSYRVSGWEIGRKFQLDLEGLPTHIYQENGETHTKPCAEITMTHEACDVLIEQGLIPLISFKDTDRVRIGGFQSIAFPSKDLRGRWN